MSIKLVYLQGSLEVSRKSGWGDKMAMWNVYGVAGIPEGSTRTLLTIKDLVQIRKYL
jgi:hypothetical protein